ncbi:MAG: CDP-alcohol phosphatidyltransferase family protein [Firmicutes bacterium]|nr:CDP-alcohol phosphatidyltransferase family protein [Bacillota bacterium]
MLGFYDYTVWLTYISLMSAVSGIVVSLSGNGHPYFGMLFLLVSGLCDAFDGKVARKKQGRTKQEQSFGVQIDSLSDLVAFGVLPACIGVGVARVSSKFDPISFVHTTKHTTIVSAIFITIALFYALAAMIRLAYFNVMAEEKMVEGSSNTIFIGLPVTTAALIFPFILILRACTPLDLTLFYFTALLVTGILFLGKFQIRKPGSRGLVIMLAIGLVEFIAIIVTKFILKLPW